MYNHTEYMRQWYKKNKRKHISYVKGWEAKQVMRLQAYKEDRGCDKCGETFPQALEFHHKDPADKVGNVGDLVKKWKWERIMTEISKCSLLCANCHRKQQYRAG